MNHSPGFLRLVEDAKKRVRETTPEAVHERMNRAEKFLLVDVREESEFAAGRIPGAVHIGRGILERDIEERVPDHSAAIILYCGGGFRSALSADNLGKMGYTNVVSMDGGWRRWNELGYETVR
ncbi:MAG TPA: rhodanese-like domain-containing protein [Bacteroidota bacterium]|nr:rhodanese-like domain-containing protein [Bacteroidota bacterium]